MRARQYPRLDAPAIVGTRDAVHAYSHILGDWRASCVPHRKHWWERAVKPSVRGISTGIVHANIDFELELDLRDDRLRGSTATGAQLAEPLAGRPARDLAERVAHFLLDSGIDARQVPVARDCMSHTKAADDYSPQIARDLATTFRSVAAALEKFRAGIFDESGPIQIWPHHFDLAMMWLPGEKIHGQDPQDEERSDKQMNFGFSFGDVGIPEPYFYTTAYPVPDAFPGLPLPSGTTWHSAGFSGTVLLYKELVELADPDEYLVNLWNGLLSAGRAHLLTHQS